MIMLLIFQRKRLVWMTQVLTRLKNSSTWITCTILTMLPWLTILTTPFVPTTSCCMISTMWSVLSKKSLSLTNLQVVLWKVVVSQMDSTKPLRQKKVCQFKKKRRHLPQSLTKICSVCTRNCQGWLVLVKLRKMNSVKFITCESFRFQPTVQFNVLTMMTFFTLPWMLNSALWYKMLNVVMKRGNQSLLVRLPLKHLTWFLRCWLKQVFLMKCLMPRTTKKKRILSWMRVNVVPLRLRPTWPVVVPTSNLVKGFLTLVDSVSLVQSVTKAVVSITSCVVVRDVKGTQENLNSIFHLKTNWCVASVLIVSSKSWNVWMLMMRILLSNHVCWHAKWKRLKNVSKEITTILVNKSFSTMTLCVNNVKSSTLSVMMLSQRNVTLNLRLRLWLRVRLTVR